MKVKNKTFLITPQKLLVGAGAVGVGGAGGGGGMGVRDTAWPVAWMSYQKYMK